MLVQKNRKVIFVFHDAELTGANLVLLRYIQAAREFQNDQLAFVFGKNGQITSQLSSFGEILLLDQISPRESLFKRVKNKLGVSKSNAISKWELLNRFIASFEPELIYFNTILSVPVIKGIETAKKCKYILHIHELTLAFNYINPELEIIRKKVDFLIANSIATKKFLLNILPEFNEKITVHYPVLPDLTSIKNEIPKLFKSSRFVIGSSGTAIGRKGAFLFILLAHRIKQIRPDLQFQMVWVGNCKLNHAELKYDIQQLKLEGIVEFIGEVPDPINYYRCFDVFVSLSKEESFGLSLAEAAMCGKPLIGFKNAGAVEELIQDANGDVVPYIEIDSMAERLVSHIEKPEENRGKIANSEFVKRFTADQIIPEWIKTIDSLI